MLKTQSKLESSARVFLKHIIREADESDDKVTKEVADALRKMQLWGDFGGAGAIKWAAEPPAEIFKGVDKETKDEILNFLRVKCGKYGSEYWDDDAIADGTSDLLEWNGYATDYKSAETDAFLAKLRKKNPAHPAFGGKSEACKGKKKKVTEATDADKLALLDEILAELADYEKPAHSRIAKMQILCNRYGVPYRK